MCSLVAKTSTSMPLTPAKEVDGEFMKMEPNAPIGLWPELDYEGETINDLSARLAMRNAKLSP